MDREQIIRWAREAGMSFGLPPDARKEQVEVVLKRLERFAELIAAQAIKYGPSYQMGYADGAFEERQAIAAMVKPLDESLADEILARGNNA